MTLSYLAGVVLEHRGGDVVGAALGGGPDAHRLVRARRHQLALVRQELHVCADGSAHGGQLLT